MGKYEPLCDHLRQNAVTDTSLTLMEIEALTGAQLPAAAARPDWWSQNGRAWIKAGFGAHHLGPGRGILFTRQAASPAAADEGDTPGAGDWALLANEASVELRVVLPLLETLGYQTEDIAPKVPLTFQEGRKGRKAEADFIVFSGPLHSRDTALIVVEAKGPGDTITTARAQADSYAFAARAPFVLLCDARTIELWQVSALAESQRLLICQLADLPGQTGALQRHIGKAAAIAYVRDGLGKSLGSAVRDFRVYEDRESERVAEVEGSEPRRLINGTQREIGSDRLLEDFPQGAVILGGSGSGKSTLSLALHRHALSNRRTAPPGRLPVHITLTDCAPDETLLQYSAKRLAAHKPGLTLSGLEDLLRQEGLILICDGFDRLDAPLQQHREIEFRTLMRDHINLQMFVLSRPAVLPAIALPTEELQLFNAGERQAAISRRLGPLEAQRVSLPDMLETLCATPLILGLVLDHWIEKRTYPAEITDLFQTWLDRLLRRNPRGLSDHVARVRAMTLMAASAQGGRISVESAVTLLSREGVPGSMVDDLTTRGALSLDETGRLVFEHEALSDYLRARNWVDVPPEELAVRIDTAVFQPGSFFPVLLMALLADPPSQARLWRRLAEADFSLYADALRYRGRLTSTVETSGADGQILLEELLAGVQEPAQAFFPALRSRTEARMTGDRAGSGLAVTGTLSPNWLHYGFRRPDDRPSVIVGDPDDLPRVSGTRLGRQGEDLDVGRRLGMELLRKTILDLVAIRDLPGGPIWRREWLRGQLSAAGKQLSPPLSDLTPLTDWRRVLSASPRQWFTAPGQSISSESLLAAVQAMIAEGVSAFPADRLAPGWTHSLGDADLQAALTQHFVLEQQLYRELVEAVFPRLADRFGWYVCLPVRWTMSLSSLPHLAEHSVDPRWLDRNWTAMAEGEDTTPVFTEELDVMTSSSRDGRAMFDVLRKLGRNTEHAVIMSYSSSIARFESGNGERSPVSGAIEALTEDLKRIFEVVPTRDR